MRRVLRNSDEVFHFWANQRQSEGRAGNVSFDGAKLFSYAACIAKLYRHPSDGATVAVFTTRKYSVTTSGHMSGARRAARHLRSLQVVNPADSAAWQLEATAKSITALLDKASRARQNKPYLLAEAAGIARNFNAYAELRGESVRINEQRLDGVQEQIEALEAERNKRLAEEAAQRERDNAEAIAAWINGASHRPWTATPRLRFIAAHGGDVIETSFGAEIPLDDAKRLWPLIQRQRSEGLTHEFGNRYMLGGYRLTTIRSDGSIVVGCHDIAYSEIERIAQQLGLLETETA